MEFEDILKDIGGYGKYQRNLVLLFLAPVNIVLPMIMLSNVFIITIPDHWCNVPELAHLSLNISEQRRISSDVEDSSCLMYDLDYGNFSTLNRQLDAVQNVSSVPCKNGWIYDKSNYEATVATKWNLVCENAHYISLVLTLQNLGGVVGAPFTSILSDKYGRKIVYFSIVSYSVIMNFFTPFIQDFYLFVVIRIFYEFIYPPILILPYILALELIPPEQRTRTSYVWNFSWVLGMCTIPLVLYLSRSWTNYCWILSGIGFLLLIFWKFISESPRWLISQKRYEEARDVILKIAKTNGHSPNPKSLLLNLQALGEKIDQENKEEEQSFYAILKSSRLRKHFLILTANCFANHTMYSIVLYNASNLEGNEFLNLFLLALAEAPGIFIAWLTMERLGRRWSAVGGYIIAGIACIIPVAGLPYSDIVSSIAAKFIVAGMFMITDQQICELFPTAARSFAMGSAKAIGYGLAFYQPYIIYLSIYGKAIPFVVISLTCFSIGIVASFLPETLNRNLPQKVEDAEGIGRGEKYFSFKPQEN